MAAPRFSATTAVVRANRASPPDAVLGEIYRRTRDRPFRQFEDMIRVGELEEITNCHKRTADCS